MLSSRRGESHARLTRRCEQRNGWGGFGGDRVWGGVGCGRVGGWGGGGGGGGGEGGGARV